MYTVIEYYLKTNGDAEGRGAVSLVGPTGSSPSDSVLVSGLFIPLLLLKGLYAVCLSNSTF